MNSVVYLMCQLISRFFQFSLLLSFLILDIFFQGSVTSDDHLQCLPVCVHTCVCAHRAKRRVYSLLEVWVFKELENRSLECGALMPLEMLPLPFLLVRNTAWFHSMAGEWLFTENE